jgi:hypothetical protein
LDGQGAALTQVEIVLLRRLSDVYPAPPRRNRRRPWALLRPSTTAPEFVRARKTAGHPYKFPGSFGDGTNGQLRTEPRGPCRAIGIEAARHCRYAQVVAQPDESEFSQPILAKRVWSAMEIARRRISFMLLPAIQKSE